MTELLVAQFMWLDYDSPTKPIYLYINSSGTQVGLSTSDFFSWLIFVLSYIFLFCSCLFAQNEKMETVGSETEAYAVADTMAVSS